MTAVFNVLGHQYGRRDFMRKRCITIHTSNIVKKNL